MEGKMRNINQKQRILERIFLLLSLSYSKSNCLDASVCVYNWLSPFGSANFFTSGSLVTSS